MSIASTPLGQFADKSWLLNIFLPSTLPLVLLAIFAVSFWNVNDIIGFYRSLSSEVQAAAVTAIAAIFLCTLLQIEIVFKSLNVSPTGAFNKEVAGRFSALVKYFAHFEDYPFRRYGIDSHVLWPRLWLILPTDVRLIITEQVIGYSTSAIYYTIMRCSSSLLCTAFCGVLLGLAKINIANRWWLTMLALWLCLFFIRISYFSGPWVGGKEIRRMANFVSFCQLVLAPGNLISHAFIVTTMYCLTIFFWYCTTLVHPHSQLEINPIRILLCCLQIFGLYQLASAMYNRMVFTGISCGATIQSSYDIYRHQLALALTQKPLSEAPDEKSFWQSKATFIRTGSSLILPVPFYKDDNPYIKAQAEKTARLSKYYSSKKALVRLAALHCAKFQNSKQTLRDRLWLRVRLVLDATGFLFVGLRQRLNEFRFLVCKDPSLWD